MNEPEFDLAAPTAAVRRHARVARFAEPAVLLAAILTVPLTVVELQGGAFYAEAADWAIWAVFVLAFLALLGTAPNRRRYIRHDWLTLVIIVVSLPLLPAGLGLTRLLRLLRLTRLVTVAARAVPALRFVLGRYELVYLVALTALLVVCAGVALSTLEPSVKGDFGGGLWWAIVTVTTVGYGDISPQTPQGRLVAVGLMLIGIGLTATLAAAIAAHFVQQDRHLDHQDLVSRLDRLETALLKPGTGQADQAAPDDRGTH